VGAAPDAALGPASADPTPLVRIFDVTRDPDCRADSTDPREHRRHRLVAGRLCPGPAEFYGGGADQLGRQLVAAGATFAFSFVVTALIALALEKSVGFRIEEEHEMTGLDQVLHAETAYDLHTAGGARTHTGAGTGTLLS
jgi:hypothetical protein